MLSNYTFYRDIYKDLSAQVSQRFVQFLCKNLSKFLNTKTLVSYLCRLLTPFIVEDLFQRDLVIGVLCTLRLGVLMFFVAWLAVSQRCCLSQNTSVYHIILVHSPEKATHGNLLHFWCIQRAQPHCRRLTSTTPELTGAHLPSVEGWTAELFCL